MTTSRTDRLLRRLDQLMPVVSKPWTPNLGAQSLAYHHSADELGYGGSPGGGKTSLLIGLALQAHRRSIIYRREAAQLKEIQQQVADLLPTAKGQSVIQLANRTLELAGIKHEKDKNKWRGRPHDLKAWDELTEFTRSQYEFVNIWNRTTYPGQRCRIVATFNPPTTVEGRWVLDHWGPWLNPKHPNPAQSGEVRYFVGRDEVTPETPNARSRSFIYSQLSDNPILAATSYGGLLAALPPELRHISNADFGAGISDHPYQVCPSAWVEAAIERGKQQAHDPLPPQDTIAQDVSRGGSDRCVVAARHGHRITLWETAGKDTPDGQAAALQLLSHRQDNSRILIDLVGVGSSCFDILKLQGHDPTPVIGSARSLARSRSGQFGFANLRAELHWKFRELLDPSYGATLALPDHPQLLSELTAPRFFLGLHGIQVESKDDIKRRLGRSPDLLDAVLMSCYMSLQYSSSF